MSVDRWLMLLVVTIWAGVAVWQRHEFVLMAFLVSLVLTVGALLLLIFPDALGEADLVLLAGMATLMDFWQLIFAVAIACLAGFAAYLLLRRPAEGPSEPLPFLPCLVVGGVTVLGGIL